MSSQCRKIVLDAILACIGCAGVNLAVWMLLPYQPRAILTGSFDWVLESPDGRTLVTTDAPPERLRGLRSTGPLRVWDIETGQERSSFFTSADQLDREVVGAYAEFFSADGKLFIARRSGSPSVIDLARGEIRWKLLPPGDPMWPGHVLWSPDGRLVVRSLWGNFDPALPPDAVSPENLMQLLDPATGRVVSEFRGNDCPIAWDFSPDSTTLALAYQDRSSGDPERRLIRLRDVSSGRVGATLEDATALLGFSPDGKVVLTTNALWDAATGQQRGRLPKNHQNHSFSPDSRWLATFNDFRSDDRNWELKIWDVATGELLADLSPPGWVQSAEFSPDRRWLTVKGARTISSLHGHGIDDFNLTVWETSSWRELAQRNEASFWDYSHTDNGELKLICHADSSLRIINAVTGREQVVFSVPSREVLSWMHWPTADGRTLVVHVRRSHQPGPLIAWLSRWFSGLPAASSDSSEFRLVDVRNVKEIATIPTSPAAYFSITADSRTLITQHGDFGREFIQLWDLPPRKPLAWLLAAPIVLLLLGLAAFAGRRLRQRRTRTT